MKTACQPVVISPDKDGVNVFINLKYSYVFFGVIRV